jgi:L-amino acid N-acyltransferase YncA
MLIRPATEDDASAIWAILQPVIRAGETFTLDRDMSREEALAHWFSCEPLVAVEEEAVLGTYYLRRNQAGGGGHVGNASYMVSAAAGGRGVGRAMGEHSLEEARARGFRAMQFNFVVSTNERAVRLWQSLGFDIVGRLPGAFEHPRLGLVDALVMFRTL